MSRRVPLVIRIGVVASSILLVTGFIGYRAGYLFSGLASSDPNPETSSPSPSDEDLLKEIERFGMLVRIPEDQIDELRRRPGKASSILVQHDAIKRFINLAPSSKDVVLLPPQPVNRDKAIKDYRNVASLTFARLDLNRDGKLSPAECGEANWRHFEEMKAVTKGAVDSEGFLKNFPWFVRHL